MTYKSLNDLTLQEGLDFLNAPDLTHQLAILSGLSYEEYSSLPASPSLLSGIPDLTIPDPIDFPVEKISTQQWLDLQNSQPYEVLELDLSSKFVESYPIIAGFMHAISEITAQFTNIFPTNNDTKPDSFTQTFGRLHLIIQVCKETLTPLPEVLQFPLIQTLNLISYIQYNSKRVEALYQKPH